jgi:hypothetical protein
MHTHRIGDVTVLNDYAPVPGFGGAPPLFLPVNALVLHAEQRAPGGALTMRLLARPRLGTL